jgi:hypothetical protein
MNNKRKKMQKKKKRRVPTRLSIEGFCVEKNYITVYFYFTLLLKERTTNLPIESFPSFI